MTVNPELELVWSGGSLDLLGINDGDDGEFLIEALGEGTNWGNPETVRRAIRSALLDGSRSVKERDDNRTVTLKLRITAADGLALAGGETPLALLDTRPFELVWRPPDEFAAAATFIGVSATLAHDMDDFEETRLRRYYTLTLDCLPHTYSNEYVTIPAVAQGVSTRNLVDDCTSLTGWTATNAVLSLNGDGTAIVATGITEGPVTVTRTGAVDLTTDVFLVVEGGLSSMTAEVQGTDGTWTTISGAGDEGGAKLFDTSAAPDPTITAIRFTLPWSSTTWRTISKQATPSSLAKRSHVRTLEVPGSARTPASLLVESATTGLGTVLLYSGPAYNPSMIRGAASTIANPVGLSGEMVIPSDGSPVNLDIPAAEFFEGDHSLWLQASTSGSDAGDLTVTKSLVTSAGAPISTETVTTKTFAAGTASAMSLLGSANLPGASLPADSTAMVRFTFSWVPSAGVSGINVTELLAFNRTEGDLTIAEAGAYKKLWADSATLTTDRPAVYVGDGDKADAIPLSLTSQLPSWPGAHEIEAPVTYLYTGTTGADDAEVSGTFRPAWFLHPAV